MIAYASLFPALCLVPFRGLSQRHEIRRSIANSSRSTMVATI